MIDFSRIVPALSSLWEGMLMTLKLMVLGVPGSVALGTMLALMRLSHSKLLSNIAGFYVNYSRSIPLLPVVTWFYFMVPFILRWVTGEDTPVGVLTSYLVVSMIFEAVYYYETVRVGVQVIPKGQMGATQALGMTHGQTIHPTVLPQAFRKMTPLLLQRSIILSQDASLVCTVGLMDFSDSTRPCGDIIGQANEFLIFAGLVYLVVGFTVSFTVKRLQKKLTV